MKNIYLKILRYLNFKKYAIKKGVNISSDCRLIGRDIDFGSEPYLIKIGNHVTISNNVQFITHDGSTFVFRENNKYKHIVKFGKIEIGDNCFIGSRSIILPNIKIGDNVVVAAGSVVTKSIPNNCVVAGNPAKYICPLDEFIEKSVKETPNYDLDNFKNNKKNEVIKICDSINFKKELETNEKINKKSLK
ncbi:MAG: acyltransferase [Firmicutes bacterium]|nr:acyltransferase [Bacillota bacterium]